MIDEDDDEVRLQAGATYGSLGEQRLSAAEERFERARRTVGLFLGPAVLMVVYLLPLRIQAPQHRLAAILAFVIVYWISEAIPIPITGLLGIVLCVVLGVGSARDVMGGFGDPAVFLFIGAFIIAGAMLKHGLARRFAFRILSLRLVGSSTTRIVIAFGVITVALSAFISNTATVAMLLPTALGILGTLATLMRRQAREGEWRHAIDADGRFDPSKLRVGTALMLMLAFGASVGGLLTPIGTPPNIIGRRLIEQATQARIGFLQWVLVAAPIGIAMFVALAVILLMLNKPEVKRLAGIEEYVARERARLGPLSLAERNTLVAFGVAVVLWVVPGVVGLLAGVDSAAYAKVTERLDEGVVAVAAASLLFLLPIRWETREFTLRWRDAAEIDWGTILLFGAGIVFGGLMRRTGLAEQIGRSTADFLGVASLLPITVFATVIAILISETTSNTAAASVVVPIVLPVATAAHVDPLIPGMAAVFGASFGFMLPVSTPQNAIVYGSGFVPITKMVRSGVLFDALGALIILIGIPIMVRLVLE
ncbi:MAG TPA: DASS family sodium-coupled anion symporter [Vicinamibacteria bacterium]|nr:DASS family sodium-coupled anion symporter [Vicinamibacteria bacterium]